MNPLEAGPESPRKMKKIKIRMWKDGIHCPACGWNSITAAEEAHSMCYIESDVFNSERIEKSCSRCDFVWFERLREDQQYMFAKILAGLFCAGILGLGILICLFIIF